MNELGGGLHKSQWVVGGTPYSEQVGGGYRQVVVFRWVENDKLGGDYQGGW